MSIFNPSAFSSSVQNVMDFATNEIRKRINHSFVGEQISSRSMADMKSVLFQSLKDMEQAGIFRASLTEQDIRSITEIMLLEWNVPDYDGIRKYDTRGYTIEVSCPNVRELCEAMSYEAIKTMVAPCQELDECKDTTRFFFLEMLRREGRIDDWSFVWTDTMTRAGHIRVIPAEHISC